MATAKKKDLLDAGPPPEAAAVEAARYFVPRIMAGVATLQFVWVAFLYMQMVFGNDPAVVSMYRKGIVSVLAAGVLLVPLAIAGRRAPLPVALAGLPLYLAFSIADWFFSPWKRGLFLVIAILLKLGALGFLGRAVQLALRAQAVKPRPAPQPAPPRQPTPPTPGRQPVGAAAPEKKEELAVAAPAMKAMNCPKCGAVVKPGSRRCPKCNALA